MKLIDTFKHKTRDEYREFYIKERPDNYYPFELQIRIYVDGHEAAVVSQIFKTIEECRIEALDKGYDLIKNGYILDYYLSRPPVQLNLFENY